MTTGDPIPALKQQMGGELARAIDGWATHDIAAMLRTDRSRIAELRRGKLDRFSLETLIRLAARARKQVELRVTDRPPDRARRPKAPQSGAEAT